MNRTLLIAFLAIFIAWPGTGGLFAQETFPENGVQDQRPRLFAFTNATIVVSAGKTIKNGMLLVRKGKIEAVGSKLNIPRGAVVWDLEGKFIYPSFIDLYSSSGLHESPERNSTWDSPPTFLSGNQEAYAGTEETLAEY